MEEKKVERERERMRMRMRRKKNWENNKTNEYVFGATGMRRNTENCPQINDLLLLG
jgi:hypothetical protein